ncbi:uncharacterized protein LOC108209912 isoform X2 [Daucus carota subsp. sativus]|uniref:uncharacterized protein LOC108209912 isoform X2 n=1 Tax=Daucus carota subsp. sativus TaxID=79200 RepID=UPI003083C75C
MWNMERNNKSNMNSTPTFSICCKDGAVVLPREENAPEPLSSLLHGSERSAGFRRNIRVYNSMFATCSSGGWLQALQTYLFSTIDNYTIKQLLIQAATNKFFMTGICPLGNLVELLPLVPLQGHQFQVDHMPLAD